MTHLSGFVDNVLSMSGTMLTHLTSSGSLRIFGHSIYTSNRFHQSFYFEFEFHSLNSLTLYLSFVVSSLARGSLVLALGCSSVLFLSDFAYFGRNCSEH